MQGFGIRFQICDRARLKAFYLAYEHIRACKASNEWHEKKEEWLSFFDAQALQHFWWPTPQEFEDWKRDYFSTPVPQRYADTKLKRPWDFMSMFEAFKAGDYVLNPIKETSEQEAILEFTPNGHPYGSTDCMVALIESFGHKVLEVVS